MSLSEVNESFVGPSARGARLLSSKNNVEGWLNAADKKELLLRRKERRFNGEPANDYGLTRGVGREGISTYLRSNLLVPCQTCDSTSSQCQSDEWWGDQAGAFYVFF